MRNDRAVAGALHPASCLSILVSLRWSVVHLPVCLSSWASNTSLSVCLSMRVSLRWSVHSPVSSWASDAPLSVYPFCRVRFTASRDVAADEQLTISYINGGLPVAERQRMLKWSYGFDCGCDLCLRELWPNLVS
jgi:hypothetical protein